MRRVEAAADAPAGLDQASLAAVHRCCRRVVLPVSLALWPWLTGGWGAAEAMRAMALWLTANAMVCCGVALWRRERLAGGSLNHWDEALLCLAGGCLAHLVRGMA